MLIVISSVRLGLYESPASQLFVFPGVNFSCTSVYMRVRFTAVLPTMRFILCMLVDEFCVR